MAESPPPLSTSTGNYYDEFQSSPRVASASRLSMTTETSHVNQNTSTSSNTPLAPPITADLSKQLSPNNSNTITEIKSESALVRRQRMAGEALKQLQAMHVHLGFSFDAVEEHGNPYLGLLVDSVEPDAPAWIGGLRHGDVVLEVNGSRTLTLQELMDSIDGLVPGTPVQFIVDREDQEVEIIVTLGGKGQNQQEIVRLYSLVQSVQNGTDELVRTGALSLSDVLETPQFRAVLLKYMEANLCAESVHFLQVEQAYQRLNQDSQQSRRAYLAHIIASEFINEHGEQMVNIDADTRKLVLNRLLKLNDTSSLLFHDAAKVVYKMCENDVFRRFVTSDQYQSMVHEPQLQENVSMRVKRRRTPSWSVIAFEDNNAMLEEISLSFAKTPVVQDRRYHLKKYKAAFRGLDLVNWLCEAGYSKNRPAAVALGQRLWDAFYIRHVTEEAEFEDNDKLYTFISLFAAEPINPQEVTNKAGGANNVFTCSILLKGVRYNRLFCLITKEKKKLWLFRSEKAALPLHKIRLKGTTFFTQQGPKSAIPGSSSTINALSNALSNATVKSNTGHMITDEPSNFKRELITYLHIDSLPRGLTFRIEGEETAVTFMSTLIKAGSAQTAPKE